MRRAEDVFNWSELDSMRRTVLDALDSWALENVPNSNGHGWNDSDLPGLFDALNQHALVLHDRHCRKGG